MGFWVILLTSLHLHGLSNFPPINITFTIRKEKCQRMGKSWYIYLIKNMELKRWGLLHETELSSHLVGRKPNKNIPIRCRDWSALEPFWASVSSYVKWGKREYQCDRFVRIEWRSVQSIYRKTWHKVNTHHSSVMISSSTSKAKLKPVYSSGFSLEHFLYWGEVCR